MSAAQPGKRTDKPQDRPKVSEPNEPAVQQTPVEDEPVEEPAAPVAPLERDYVALIEGETPSVWVELGTVSADTRAAAWEAAKVKWPQLVPAVEPARDEGGLDGPLGPVHAKIVPARNFVTIQSTVEYVKPRAIATGV